MQITLHIDNLPGESTIAGAQGSIDCIAIFDAVRSKKGDGKARHSEIVLSRPHDAASPKLASKCATGANVGTAMIKLYHTVSATTGTSTVPYAQIKLTNVYISRYERNSAEDTGIAYGPHLGYGSYDVPDWRGRSVTGKSTDGDSAANRRMQAAPQPFFNTPEGEYLQDKEIERVFLCGDTVTWTALQNSDGSVANISTGWDISAGAESAGAA